MKIRHATVISFLALNFLPLSVFGKISYENHNTLDEKAEKKSSQLSSSLNSYPQIEINKFIYLIANNLEDIRYENSTQNNIRILSNKQLHSGEIFTAEGDVVFQNGSSVMVAEKLQYNFKSKILIINGDIRFNSKDQFLLASELKYDFKNATGFIKDIYGSINFNNLGSIKIEKEIDKNIDERIFLDNEVKNVSLNTTGVLGTEELKLDDLQKWRFKTSRIDIKDNEWFSKKLVLTNDPFNKPQLLINNTGFKSVDIDGEITFKSNWSTIVLDDKIYIPTGPRTYTIDQDNLFKWGFGYDKNSKDGFFLTRNFETIYFGNEKRTKLNLQKEFYLQRIESGKTKSFSNKNESLLDSKSERDITFLDSFGLRGYFNSYIKKLNFNTDFSLNSLDFEKFKKSFRTKSEISRILYSKNKINSKKETKLSLFGNYRDKVWNGSLGEKEIISAYGMKIIKSNYWTINNVNKTSTIAASYGEYNSSDRIDSLKMISRERFNIFFDRTHSYPIWKPQKNNFIDKDYRYSPIEISSGLNINAQAKIDLYRYSDYNYQDLFTFRVGPELTLGNFKNTLLDYTKISVYPKITVAEGKSPFGFDQATDNTSIEFNLKQQLIGPITLDFKTEYNLDLDSPNYKNFFNTKFDLTWNRRAYSIGLFYKNESKTGGINFKIHSFNFDGYGDFSN